MFTTHAPVRTILDFIWLLPTVIPAPAPSRRKSRARRRPPARQLLRLAAWFKRLPGRFFAHGAGNIARQLHRLDQGEDEREGDGAD